MPCRQFGIFTTSGSSCLVNYRFFIIYELEPIPSLSVRGRFCLVSVLSALDSSPQPILSVLALGCCALCVCVLCGFLWQRDKDHYRFSPIVECWGGSRWTSDCVVIVGFPEKGLCFGFASLKEPRLLSGFIPSELPKNGHFDSSNCFDCNEVFFCTHIRNSRQSPVQFCSCRRLCI